MTSAERPVIGFLTDFGLDGAAAVCRGVMIGICPDAQVIDISHTVRKYAIDDGARLLVFALPYVPVGVHVGVVDPGVGTPRRPVAIRAARGDVLIGPDNGLLPPAADVLGGPVAARVLENRDLWLPTTSSTFHGRDIFAPVAAHLAAGRATFDRVGPAIEPAELVRLPVPEASVGPGRLETIVTYVDSFGNVRFAGARDELTRALGELDDGAALRVEIAARPDDGALVESSRFGTTFGVVPVGASLVYLDSQGVLAMADNQGNVAARLGLAAGQRIVLTRE
jgi:S-adenosylmethionine hydrolase